ncbi:MAG: site-specific integrase [Xenococcaceae cyanobacterium MO_207.B15]|nr:site-specific integrase [Xenococcaceae cyanobacterium MO_207.B15]MDJ0746312.1 site-specific integrase [Xenococcaceae cyanobacterium MO_167.B27]
MGKHKHPPVSIHPTLHGQLEVDWEQEYNGEFNCPHCQTEKITSFYYQKSAICKLQVRCKSCKKTTSLTQNVSGLPMKRPSISIHPTLHGQLEVDWEQEYNGEFNCPHCQTEKITTFYYNKSSICQLRVCCKSCGKITGLTQNVFELQHSSISIHPTLHGQLEVDWEQEYNGEFNCPHCQTGKITTFYNNKSAICKLTAHCKSCRKTISLSQQLLRTYLPISNHPTLNGILKVDWNREYQQEYNCPRCNKGKLTKYHRCTGSVIKLNLQCNYCNKYTNLTCPVPIYICNYLPNIECPNPLCNEIGNDGQKGWIYKVGSNRCRCHFCQIKFNPNSREPQSWMSNQIEDKLRPFSFDENTWYLQYFYDNPRNDTLNFQAVNPYWYRQEVKKYLHYLLKSKVFSCTSQLVKITIALRQLGKAITAFNLNNKSDINRNIVFQFLESCKNNKNATINEKLNILRNFFDWLDLETLSLIRSRDFLKENKNDADWLDEVTRQSIKQHLDKIPAPIARQYLVQAYIAARPGDVCQLNFDCLVEENGKWYIKFFQQKPKRWHKILASRKIRKVIEEQQQWIREVFNNDYSYLFCRFRTIKQASYPTFPNIRPLPQPPVSAADKNPMVNIIRMLIEKENILDANGQKPHFTGKITRSSRLQEIRTKYGMEAAQLYADHKNSRTTFQHYAPPTREQIAEVDLPFQELLLNPDNKFLPWQSLPESLLKNPKAHELDLEIAPRLVVYGHCALNPKIPCPVNLFPKCYGCSSFRPSTGKLPLYERQYQGEQQRLTEAEKVGAELAQEEAKVTIEAMDKWLPELRRLANG